MSKNIDKLNDFFTFEQLSPDQINHIQEANKKSCLPEDIDELMQCRSMILVEAAKAVANLKLVLLTDTYNKAQIKLLKQGVIDGQVATCFIIPDPLPPYIAGERYQRLTIGQFLQIKQSDPLPIPIVLNNDGCERIVQISMQILLVDKVQADRYLKAPEQNIDGDDVDFNYIQNPKDRDERWQRRANELVAINSQMTKKEICKRIHQEESELYKKHNKTFRVAESRIERIIRIKK